MVRNTQHHNRVHKSQPLFVPTTNLYACFFSPMRAVCLTHFVLLDFISVIRMAKSAYRGTSRHAGCAVYSHSCRLGPDSFQRIRQISRSSVTFYSILVLFCSEVILTPHPSPKWRAANSWLLATAFLIYSHLSPYMETTCFFFQYTVFAVTYIYGDHLLFLSIYLPLPPCMKIICCSIQYSHLPHVWRPSIAPFSTFASAFFYGHHLYSVMWKRVLL
jgi:hypothetical protein